MPLTRYQIRNEFSLADPELYRAADKDDPEALLEGVAMSGLVGVLRQLGDLAEFAAEIFHDLHEEVMATASRGHVLMVRVKQLEAEFPSIEKAFLSQTNNSLFFTNSGVDWHPNLRTENNLITRGDLPRCVLDSYEECRGPPRLFLLDKFDVAGAGACLKRYTDPSFFKAESAFHGIAPLEVQREKKARKVKKKGSRWKNGGTPEFAQASHAKLHQLFLEESIENAYNDPSRLVKLKRRQLNETPLDAKSGKSYMEKFLETPPAENNAVYEISNSSPLRLTLDNSSESGPETLDINTVSPVKVSSQENETARSVPTVDEIILKPSIEECNGEAIDREIIKVPEPVVNFKDGMPPSLHEVTTEEEIIVDGEGREECNIYGDHSDDLTSEADKYIDALTNMESEVDTDIEYRPKNDIGFMDIGKYQTVSHVNEERLGVQAHSSDSQSDRISYVSDDGNSSIKKGRSSSTYSDTIDNLTRDMPSDGEVAAKAFPSKRNYVTEIVEAPHIQLPTSLEMQCPSSSSPKDILRDLGDASYSSCPEDLNSTHILLDEVSSMAIPLPEPQHQEVPSDSKTNSNLSESDGGKGLYDASEVYFADSSEKQVTVISLSAESHPVDELYSGDTAVSSDASERVDEVLPVAPEKRSCSDHLDEALGTEFAGEICADNSVNQTISSPNCTFSLTEEQRICSTVAEGERSSDLKLERITPVMDTSEICGFNEQQVSDISHDDPKPESDLIEIGASFFELKQDGELFDATEGEGTREFTHSANVVEEDAVPCDLLYDCADNLNLKDSLDLDDLAAENVHSENIAESAASCGSADFGDVVDNTAYVSSNLIGSPSGKLMNLEESLAGDGDMCHEELESNEVVSRECLTELEMQEETNQAVGTPADIYYASSHSNLEEDFQSSSLAEPTKDSLNFVDLTTAPASSELTDKESELKYLSHLMESREDIHTNQPEVERLHIVEDSSKRIQSLDHVDQGKCLQTSFEHFNEGYSSQPPLDFPELSGKQNKQESYQSDLIHPGFDLHPEATKATMEEMPPLPPLPPMQWRIGKLQHVNTAPQRELAEHGQGSFPMMLQFETGEKDQLGLPASEQGFKQSGNPFLPHLDGEEKSGNVSDQLAADFMQPSPFSLHPSTMGGHNNSQCNIISLDSTHSNPFLTLPTTSLEYGSLAMEGDKVESGSSLAMPPTDVACRHIPVSLHDETESCPNQFVLDRSLEGGTLQDPKQNFDREHGNYPDVSLPLPTRREEQIPAEVAEDPPIKVEEQFPTRVDEQSQHGLEASEEEKPQTLNAIVPEGETAQRTNTTLEHDLSTSEGEAVLPSNTLSLSQVAEEGNSIGNPPLKLPRPRSPLIDAVAAHDKSKLRKVTERLRPPMISKVDERDSLLEQIRNKSFNLKPAAVTRPSVQGPKTNLRVAAILEKANAIRQAFAGSDDEDDDEDDWSDS